MNMNFLNSIDIYGTEFNFTTFNRRKYTSKLGGIMTVISFGMLLALLIVFGQPVWHKKNPGVILQTHDFPNYPMYTLSNSQFPIAFRFENEKKIGVNLEGFVYPALQFIKQKKNHSTNSMDTFSNVFLNYTKCNNDILKNENLTSALENWYCVDWSKDNFTLGGLYDNSNDYINYFKITIFYCKFDGVNYSNCTDYNDLNSLLNGKVKIYYSMMIPDAAIMPADPQTPVSVSLTNMFFTLSPLLMRTDRYYYDSVKVSQDIGWFFEAFNYFQAFSFQRRDTDTQMRTQIDYNDLTKIKTLATTVFYITNKEIEYQINFQKIQYVIANMGGVLKIFTTIFTLLMYYLCAHLRYFHIVNEVFDFNLNLKNNKFEKNQKNSFKIINHNYFTSKKPVYKDNSSVNHIIEHNEEKLNQFKNSEKIKVVSNMKANENIGNENIRVAKNDSMPMVSVANLSKPINSKNSYLVSQKRNSKSFDNHLNVNSYGRFKNYIYNRLPLKIIIKKLCCNYDSKNIASRIYFYAESIIKERLDILYYVRFVNKFDALAGLVLGKEQKACLNYLKNEVMTPESLSIDHFYENVFKSDREYNETEIQSIIQHFKRIQNRSDEPNSIDKKLLDLVNDKIAKSVVDE